MATATVAKANKTATTATTPQPADVTPVQAVAQVQAKLAQFANMAIPLRKATSPVAAVGGPVNPGTVALMVTGQLPAGKAAIAGRAFTTHIAWCATAVQKRTGNKGLVQWVLLPAIASAIVAVASGATPPTNLPKPTL